jgi:hypothetical protein
MTTTDKAELTLINGNGKPYTLPLPRLYVLGGHWNDVALAHVKENTGLTFEKKHFGGMEAQPETCEQIAKLFMTYNFKTQYHNNGDTRNTIYLKSDHHQGFQVDSICFDCCKHNHIHLNGLKQGDRLAC